MIGKTNHIKWLLCVLLVLVAACTAAAGGVIYVDDDTVGTNDGSSWANAFNYLQDAITTASAGDEIRVGQGIYTPDHGAGITPGDREATFQIINGVTLAGGYAGFGELDPNVRNVELYETILSGDLQGNDVYVNDPRDLLDEPTYNDNSYHIVASGGNEPDTIIDGFIISHGNGWGSGIRITSGGSTILNCTFKYNSGSAIDSRQSSLRLNECSFIGNRADSGGGVWSWGDAVLTSCVFRDNSASDKGGAVAHNGGILELIDCEFINNSVSWSLNNDDDSEGGALWAGTSEKVAIKNCIFKKNSASFGGAIRGYGNDQIDNCVFTDNLAEYGGALYGLPDSTIMNCIFSGNRADEGGVLFTRYGPNLINCTFADNWAQNGKVIGWDMSGRGGGGLVKTITNCILWNGFDEIRLHGDKLPNITITHTNIQGGWPSWPWQGILYSDPCFVKQGYWIHANDPDVIVEPNDPNAVWIDGDYHLKSQAGRWDPVSENWVVDDMTSSCIDAGDPNSPVAFEPFPNGGIINMGAYGGTTEASMSPSGIHAKYGGGSGTAKDPYLIYTAEQMNTIGADMDDWDKHFKLMADIDLSIYSGTDFNIIGYGLFPAFTGVFDGNGHTISNFTYSSTGETCIGIFGYVLGPNARIINVGMIDPNVNGGTAAGVGSLAGWIDLGTVTNCHVVGGSVTGKQLVGGLIGSSAVITDCYAVGGRVIAEGSAGCLVGGSGGSIIDCYATGNVTGSNRVGGLVGSNRGGIVGCNSNASVEGRDAVGGLVGYNRGNLKDCSSTSSITGKNSTGGLVGENRGSVINCYCSCTLDAQDQVGGLVGINDGIITASYSSASIHGLDEIGGFVGYNKDDAEIVNCYANGDVIGQRYVGGLVGNNATGGGHAGGLRSGTISNCYSVTLVSGDQNVGGLIGYFGNDGVSGSFWDIEASGQMTSDGGVGKTTLEMQDPNTFIDAGWDFAGAPGGPGDIWMEPEGGGYPVLIWQFSPPPELPSFSGGSGEPDDPYLVSTADELNSIGHNPRLMSEHFKLVNDIDLTGVDFYIIASQYYPFRGTFDGNDHTISNFSYTSPEATGVGLFSYVSNGRIRNLGLIDPNVQVDKGGFHGCLVGLLGAGNVTHCYVESGSVTGQNELGGLVGENGYGGIIMNCYFTGDATGSENVGGLVGQNRGSVTTSYSYADVKGQTAVGGFVGRCTPGEIVNCYAQGNVTGQWYVGGLAGSNGSGSRGRTGTIRNCYSASTSLTGSQKGGLLGADWGGEVSNCFWDIEASGRTTSYGGEGKTTAEMHTAGTFSDAGWDFAGETENGTEDIWWILEGQDYPRLWWESAEEGE